MIVTNKYNLPENIVRAVEFSSHRRADYSVTELLKPVRMVHLGRRYDGEIVDDASNRIWVLLGSAIHYILEKSATKRQLQETYLELKTRDRLISGVTDLYEEGGIITDYKLTSAWSLVYGDRIVEWEQQLNVYAYMFLLTGLPVNKLGVVAILRDWSKGKAKRDQDYPQQPVISFAVKQWNKQKQALFVDARVGELVKYENIPDVGLPVCPPNDRWHKPDRWACMKTGRKTAVKLFDTEKSCNEWIDEQDDKDKLSVEHRPGEDVRCEKYCLVNKWCSFWNDKTEEEKDV